MNKVALKQAMKTCSPVILGYIPAGFAFGIMLCSARFSFITAVIMSLTIYTGAGQYLAVGFFVDNISIVQMAIATFFINSKHLFYGLSFLEDFKKIGKRKFYMMFALTDETYAVLNTSQTENMNLANKSDFMLYTSIINQISWVVGTALGAGLGTLVDFNSKGIDFAMTALFIVLLINQIQNCKTKYPFIFGTIASIFAMFCLGKSNMLLFASIITVVLLIIFRKNIERGETENDN